MILYHGTSSKNLENILDCGIIPNASSNWDHTVKAKEGFVYLTDTYPGYFAMMAADNDDDDDAPVILELEITDDFYLYPDEDFIGQVLYNNMKKDDPEVMDIDEFTEMIDIEYYRHAWEDSLKYMGNIAHRGIIEAEAIQRHTVFTDNQMMADWLDPMISLANHRFCSERYKNLIKLSFGDITQEEYSSLDPFAAAIKRFEQEKEALSPE